MKGFQVSDDARLIQVFLSQTQTPGPGIYEVSSTENGKFICTCPGYKGRAICKHIKFVQGRLKENDGTYPLEISIKASKEEAELAQRSNEEFREFIIKYGKIEVF